MEAAPRQNGSRPVFAARNVSQAVAAVLALAAVVIDAIARRQRQAAGRI